MSGRARARTLICDFGGVLTNPIGAGSADRHRSESSARLLSRLKIDEEMLAYVRSVKRRGWRTALLTNNDFNCGPEWRAKVPSIDALFDAVVDTSLEGVRKPDPAAYQLALAALGVTPDDCVFVDDQPRNCEAASALGMRTVHFRDARQAMREIEAALTG